MEHKTFSPEFFAPWALCFKLFSKCYCNFYVESHKEWRLYCMGLFAAIHNITMLVSLRKIFTGTINMFDVVYMILICSLTLQAVIKSMIVLHRKRDVEFLIVELFKVWRTTNLTPKQSRIKNHLLKRLKLHHKVYFLINISGTWLHLMTPLAVVLFRRVFLNEDCELTLAFDSVFPYDHTYNWIIYIVTYGFQTYAMLVVVYGLIGSEVLLLTFSCILAMEFALLRDDLENVMPIVNLNDFEDQSPFERRSLEKHRKLSIKEFIRRHQHLIRLAEQTDDVFNGMILLNILSTSFSVCLFGFASTVAQGFVEKVNNFVGVFAMLMHVFMYCYYGELMQAESLGVADSAYNNPWYEGDVKFHRIIVFIIARSHRACCLTAWRQVPITLNTFAKVSSTAWSYFSLITTVYSNHEESNSD